MDGTDELCDAGSSLRSCGKGRVTDGESSAGGRSDAPRGSVWDVADATFGAMSGQTDEERHLYRDMLARASRPVGVNALDL